jgi:hypothetical protein
MAHVLKVLGLPWEADAYSTIQEITIFYVIGKFIILFMSACHLTTLSQLNPVHTVATSETCF